MKRQALLCYKPGCKNKFKFTVDKDKSYKKNNSITSSSYLSYGITMKLKLSMYH